MPDAYAIDATTYRKLALPVGNGYDARPNGLGPESVVLHTTNGHHGSSFAAEARYLATAAGVGAHYLVGKQGQIVELLPPGWRAWHAGNALWTWRNSVSIGIECHFTPGEAWPLAGTAALTWLVRRLQATYQIPAARIATHRTVALPAGRKQDPSFWTDAQFGAWLAALSLPVVPALPRYEVVTAGANVRSGPGLVYPVTMVLGHREQFSVDTTANAWLHRVDG
ncbi:MAG TPA: peptidoglycan recognition family protein, partial [Herpetosiphonaceae bacterium]